MDDKGRMDDLASLFLPDLLHPLTSDVPPVKDEPFLFQERRSNISTPLSSGLGMFMAVPDDRDAPEPEEPPNGQYSLFGQPQGYQVAQFGASTYPNGASTYYNNFQPHRYLPFPEADFSHTLHYADFIPAEAGFQQPLRHHQRRQMLPVQAAFSPSTVIGQFDGVSWQTADEGPGPMYGGGHNGGDFAVPAQRILKSDSFARREAQLSGGDYSAGPPASAPKTKRKKDKGSLANARFDYSPELLLRLLQLHPNLAPTHVLADSAGHQVASEFLASLDGRLMTSDQDNYNHLSVFSGSPIEDEVYAPRVISCYRRNFFSLHMNFKLGNFTGPLYLAGEPVVRFRIDIGAVAEGKEGDSVSFMIIKDKEKPEKNESDGIANETDKLKARDKKDASRTKEVSVSLTEKSNPIELDNCGLENSFWIKKLQFKSATSNSSNINFQTYYRVTAQLIAETASGAHVLHDLIGVLMTVRGRNPSFYQERKDIRIKGNTDGPGADKGSRKRTVKPATESVENLLAFIKNESQDAVAPLEKRADFVQDTDNPDGANDSVTDSQNDSLKQSESVEDNTNDNASVGANTQQLAPAIQNPPATSSASSVSKMISSRRQEGKNYHYFPILSVYYLPPINVVYFPHGAHQDNTNDESSVIKEADSDASTPATSTSVERKRGSKVYFR